MDNSIWMWLFAELGMLGGMGGLFFWWIKKRIDEREKAAAEREKAKEQVEVAQLQATMAAIALCEATARAVQRIPDAHCNGDMHAALDYAARCKHDLKNVLTRVGVHALHDD